MGGRHSSVLLSARTILQPWVQIQSTSSTLFSTCIIEVGMRKGQKQKQKRGQDDPYLNKYRLLKLVQFYYIDPLLALISGSRFIPILRLVTSHLKIKYQKTTHQ